MDKWIERLMVALGIFLGIPLFISAAILFWAVALALIGVVLGQPVPDGAGAFEIRIVE